MVQFNLGCRDDVKSDGFNNQEFTYNKKTAAAFAANGTSTITLSSPYGTANEQFYYTGNPLSSISENYFIIVPSGTGYSNNKVGTVTSNGSNNSSLGGTNLTTTPFTNMPPYLVVNYLIKY